MRTVRGNVCRLFSFTGFGGIHECVDLKLKFCAFRILSFETWITKQVENGGWLGSRMSTTMADTGRSFLFGWALWLVRCEERKRKEEEIQWLGFEFEYLSYARLYQMNRGFSSSEVKILLKFENLNSSWKQWSNQRIKPERKWNLNRRRGWESIHSWSCWGMLLYVSMFHWWNFLSGNRIFFPSNWCDKSEMLLRLLYFLLPLLKRQSNQAMFCSISGYG